MTTHTPGPWIIRHGGSGFVGTEEQTVAIAYGDAPDCHPDERMQANACLITAAPELLSALEQMLDAFVDDPMTHQYTSGTAADAARDAIAKARGAQ